MLFAERRWATRIFSRGLGQSCVSQSKYSCELFSGEGTQAKGFDVEKIKVLQRKLYGRWVPHTVRGQTHMPCGSGGWG